MSLWSVFPAALIIAGLYVIYWAYNEYAGKDLGAISVGVVAAVIGGAMTLVGAVWLFTLLRA